MECAAKIGTVVTANLLPPSQTKLSHIHDVQNDKSYEDLRIAGMVLRMTSSKVIGKSREGRYFPGANFRFIQARSRILGSP